MKLHQEGEKEKEKAKKERKKEGKLKDNELIKMLISFFSFSLKMISWRMLLLEFCKAIGTHHLKFHPLMKAHSLPLPIWKRKISNTNHMNN